MLQNRFKNHLADKSWLAGFLDGDGCIYFNPTRSRKGYNNNYYTSHDIQVIISQSGMAGLELLTELQMWFGIGKVRETTHLKLGKQQAYEWRIDGEKAVFLLKEISPYLILKKEKAEKVIKFWGEKYATAAI